MNWTGINSFRSNQLHSLHQQQHNNIRCQQQQKRKGGQIRFNNDQTDKLETKFDTHKYLSPQERKRLAKMLKLTERQVSQH